MNKDITAILKEATKDMLSEQSLIEIKGAFDAAVQNAVSIHVEKALHEQDSDYSAKLEKLLEAIDADHTAKLERIVEAIDVKHADMLKKVVAGYEISINKDAETFKESLVSNLDKYLELYLEEKIPSKMVSEAVENTRANKMLAEIRSMLGVDLAMASESIREAILDGKTIIEDYKKTVSALQNENKTLKESNQTISANLVLEKNLSELSEEKKAYMSRMMKNKNAQYITENFNYILNLFDQKEEERLEVLKEQAVHDTEALQVDRPVVESTQDALETPELTGMSRTYLSELQKF